MIDINIGNLIKWSQEYDKKYTGTTNERTEIRIKQLLEAQRYLEKQDFVDLCMWKSPRSKKHYENNDNRLIKEITKYCFSTKNEEMRITKLIELRGVYWPVASVILHFAFPDKYPILDFRAIWSLGWETPSSYNFIFWTKYCNEISQIAKQMNLPIRTVDKALWAYSKENQKKNYNIDNNENRITGKSKIAGEDEVSGKINDKKNYNEREEQRILFFKTLKEMIKNKGETLFLDKSPESGYSGSLTLGAGLKGVNYKYYKKVIGGEVQLTMDDREISIDLYDFLFNYKNDIERQFGESLEWYPWKGKQRTKICKSFGEGDLSFPETWPELQGKMISAMTRFYKAIKPKLDNFAK